MTSLIRRTSNLPAELDDFFSSFLRAPSYFSGSGNGMLDEGALALDVSENDDEVIVRASLPGYSREDVEVEVHDNVLSIKAAREEETEHSGERFYRKERRSGSMSRRLALPGTVDDDNASAKLSDGVLEIRIPKSAEAHPRKLNIG